VTGTENFDTLVKKGDYCLAAPGALYIVFLKNGSGTINLENQSGVFSVQWFDPRNGGTLQSGRVKTVKGGEIAKFIDAPSEQKKDWVVLLRKL